MGFGRTLLLRSIAAGGCLRSRTPGGERLLHFSLPFLPLSFLLLVSLFLPFLLLFVAFLSLSSPHPFLPSPALPRLIYIHRTQPSSVSFLREDVPLGRHFMDAWDIEDKVRAARWFVTTNGILNPPLPLLATWPQEPEVTDFASLRVRTHHFFFEHLVSFQRLYSLSVTSMS